MSSFPTKQAMRSLRPEDGLLERSPPRPRPLDPVHVDHVLDAPEPLQDVEHGGVVTEREADVAMAGGVADRDEVEVGGAQPARSVDRDVDPLDAAPDVLGDRPAARLLAVHDDAPARGRAGAAPRSRPPSRSRRRRQGCRGFRGCAPSVARPGVSSDRRPFEDVVVSARRPRLMTSSRMARPPSSDQPAMISGAHSTDRVDGDDDVDAISSASSESATRSTNTATCRPRTEAS